MCWVSMIADNWRNNRAPHVVPNWPQWIPSIPTITREEFDALKAEMQELKELLKAAKRYDEATGQPDCETADKVTLLRQLAQLVGIDLSEVFPPEQSA